MQALHRAVASMLCCFGHSSADDSRDRPRELSNKDSPISMSVPGASVPHALNSPDALHKIFASSSSMRGYNAVQHTPSKPHKPHGSLDLDFRFGSENSKRKPHGRLEQLTDRVKQKLSETRLGRGSEEAEGSTAMTTRCPEASHNTESDPTTRLLGQSQKSLGLTDLLASRAVSEGGYDSDAKSIRTPAVLSAAGTIRLSPRYALQTTERVESNPGSTDWIEPKGATVLSTTFSSSSQKSTSGFSPYTNAFRIRPKETPSNVQCQLNIKNVEGTIMLPQSPVRCSSRQPSTDRTAKDLLSPLCAPMRTSSLRMNRHEDAEESTCVSHPTLRRPTQCIDQVQLVEVGCNDIEANSNSVITESTEKYTDAQTTKSLATILPSTAVKVHPVETDHIFAPSNADVGGELAQKNGTKSDADAHLSSDTKSVHLFNMRISQRLASTSRVPIALSTAASNNTSSRSLASDPIPLADQSSISPIARAPTFITIENIRRPSDPETKKIFEGTNSYRDRSGYKRSLSQGSVPGRAEYGNNVSQVADDSSSFYGSIFDGTSNEQMRVQLPIQRGSLKNKNSLAIGGRSISGSAFMKRLASATEQQQAIGSKSLGVESQCKTVSKLQPLQDPVRGRSVSMPKPSKFIKVDTTPTPIGRRGQASTEANERMSEVDIDRSINRHNRAEGSVSTQALEDRVNETLSEVDVSTSMSAAAPPNISSMTGDAWLSQGRRTGWGFDFANGTPQKCLLDTSVHTVQGAGNCSSLGAQTNASEIWYKAFQRLGEPSDYGRLLATPQFDREGRRRASSQSVSDSGRQIEELTPMPRQVRRSRSVDAVKREIFSSKETLKKRRRSVPILHKPLQAGNSKAKLSLADIRRRFIASGTIRRATNGSTSKDELGIWARFTSHDREQRNGPAGSGDNVKVRDFEVSNHELEGASTVASNRVRPPILHARQSWNLLMRRRPLLKRCNTKSMTFAISPAEKAKHSKRKLVGRFKRLYRTKSSEIQACALSQGHRGSVSAGLSAEYPELESLPGEDVFDRSLHNLHHALHTDGTQDQTHSTDRVLNVTPERPKSTHSYTFPWSRRDAEDWSLIYKECVLSLSTATSEEQAARDSNNTCATKGRRILSLSSALRDSTVDFQADLKQETDTAKARLLQQLQSTSEEENALRMPGSFV